MENNSGQIIIEEEDELMYILESIGLPDHFLIIGQQEKYFQTPNGYFYFGSVSDFHLLNGKMVLTSTEDKSIFVIELEQFELLKEFL